MGKRKFYVPAQREASGFPVVDILLDTVHPKIAVEEQDVELVRDQLLEFLAGSSAYLPLPVLSRERGYLFRYGAERTVAVVRAYTQAITPRSDELDLVPVAD
jgi:hypothetical protein